MKKLYITFLAVLISSSAIGQSAKKADHLFNKKAFMEAAEQYELVNEKDQEVLQKLGDSYFYTHRMEEAEDTYRLLFLRHQREIGPEYKFKFAHTLRASGKHEEADVHFSEYWGKDINFAAWEKELDSTLPYTYKTEQVTRQHSSSDFGISFLGDRVVFASTRNQDRPIYAWNKKPFLDLYIADISEDSKLSNISAFPGDVNTDTHESSASFSQDGKTMFFDRTNSERVKTKKDDLPVAHIGIYRAELVDGEWTNIEPLPFNSDVYCSEHPTLSADGSKLYFASDMPGSMEGSLDIYEVDIHEDGTFGEPRNLGPKINTPHREQFPYVSTEGTLYFSSDGRMGFGNLDLYRSESRDGSFEEAKNLGDRINSGADDFAYVLQEGENLGYIASNRRGTGDLYAFTRQESAPPVVPFEVRETNSITGAQQLKDIGNIHFAFNSAALLPEAKKSLEKVVNILKEYKDLKIEIGAHADSRGSDEYNLSLSERRAISTLEYLLSQGIEQQRLTSQGFGEKAPLNDCTEATGCKEAQYAKNRRSEFTIMEDEILANEEEVNEEL